MNNNSDSKTSAGGSEFTGLPWPKTWSGAYLFVIGSFIFWLALLLALTELCR